MKLRHLIFLALIPTVSIAQDAPPPAALQAPALPEFLDPLPETVRENPAASAPPASSESETSGRPETTAPEAEVNARPAPVFSPDGLGLTAQVASENAMTFLRDGGPSIWAIAALSVVTLTLILWKIWRLALIGAWSRGKAGKAVSAFESGDYDAALATVHGRRGIRSKVVGAALLAIRNLPEQRAREETTRIARREIANAGTGLRALELIATIAPLLGLLGTVLGMIAAFQALQQAGSRADPALLAGGIWEALLTTAAGMAVAIPASAALTWFETVIDRIRRDVEDGATRLFVATSTDALKLVAE